MGKDRNISSLEGIFKRQMQWEYFPIPLERMGAKFNFLALDENEIHLNDASLRVIKQNHPGDSYGYRIEEQGKVLVICTDLEHGENILPEIVDFCQDADVLIHEAQYTAEELKTHRGWGHSSYDQAIEVAIAAGVKQLVMTHHDPEHDDEFLNRVEKECQEKFPNALLARENVALSF